MTLPPFDRLLAEHARDLHRFMVAMVGPADADDCWQDAVLAALIAYPNVGHDGNLRGWLFTTAYRKAVDEHRRRNRASRPVAIHGAVVGTVAAPEPVDTALWAEVAGLPPMQRGAVVARHVLDRPYAEVADLLGCSEAAARQSVKAGLAALRHRLDTTGGAR